MGDPARLNALQPGEQGSLLFRMAARSGSQYTLDLVDAEAGHVKRGQLTIDRTTAPFAIAGNFAQIVTGEQPGDFKIEREVFDIAVGDELVTTDGVHYVARIIGIEGGQLAPGTWSPSDALRPVFRFEDVAQNLGPTNA